MSKLQENTREHELSAGHDIVKWINSIKLSYNIELMPQSKKTIEQAADDMITGVTIGTAQTSEGTYTPKLHCLFGPHPGAYKGEVTDVQQTSERGGIVKVAFPPEIAQTKEMGFAGLFSVAAGDGLGTAYEMNKIRLVDIELPQAVVESFPGPRFGDVGIRDLVREKYFDRALVALLLKPNTGQPSEYYARLAKEAALAGVDYLKEDELQLNHPACPLLDRVKKILAALTDAEQVTGRRVLYAPNITSGSQKQIIDNARQVVELGAAT